MLLLLLLLLGTPQGWLRACFRCCGKVAICCAGLQQREKDGHFLCLIFSISDEDATCEFDCSSSSKCNISAPKP
jgi:hypothetical protein